MTKYPRPHFRASTAEIGAMVDAARASNDTAALRVIANELIMRERPAAKLLLVAVRNMIGAVQAAPAMVAVPCQAPAIGNPAHRPLAVEARAKPSKPARAAAF